MFYCTPTTGQARLHRPIPNGHAPQGWPLPRSGSENHPGGVPSFPHLPTGPEPPAYLMVFAIYFIYRNIALAINLFPWGLPPLALALGVRMKEHRLETHKFSARCFPLHHCVAWSKSLHFVSPFVNPLLNTTPIFSPATLEIHPIFQMKKLRQREANGLLKYHTNICFQASVGLVLEAYTTYTTYICLRLHTLGNTIPCW